MNAKEPTYLEKIAAATCVAATLASEDFPPEEIADRIVESLLLSGVVTPDQVQTAIESYEVKYGSPHIPF